VGVDSPVEAEPHLRAVLETQPVVLTRVSKEGTFLAINESGLSMLGAQSLEQVLGTSLLNMVDAEERKACQAFLDRAVGGQRGSCEVDLIGLTGTRHTLELHASAHPGAPDGLASVLISFRDVTESRRLEQSLVEAASRQAEQDAAHETERARLIADVELARKAQSDQFAADEQLTELERRLAEAGEAHAALQKAHADEIDALQKQLAEERRRADSQSAAVARLDGSDQQLVELRGKYDALDSERQQLVEMAGLLRSEAEARQQTVTELTERLAALEAEHQQAADAATALRLDLDERHALVAELSAKLELLEGERQQNSEASAQLQRELESRTALANELAGRIETLEAEQASLRAAAEAEIASLRSAAAAELAAAKADAEAERAALTASFEHEMEEARTAQQALRDAADAALSDLRATFENERAGVRTELDGALKELQGRYDTDTGALRDALNGSLAEQARLAEAMAAAEEDAAQKGSRLASLEEQVNAERQAHSERLVEIEANAATRLAELEIRASEAERAHATAMAETQAALEAQAAEREARAAEREAAHTAQIADLEAGHAARIAELEAALAQAASRADEALAAIQRAEETFAAERQRLEDALVAAVDAEKAAKQAMATEIATRTVAERDKRQMQAAIERFAREAGVSIPVGGSGAAAPAPAPKAETSTKALAERLGAELPRRLGDGLPMSLLSSSADSKVAIDEQVVMGAIGAFADSRRVSMLSGQVTVEVADVSIDNGVGKVRGMSPGSYALVVLNVDGPGAQQGFPQEVFESADPRGWREVKDDLQAARAAIVAAGGQVWLSREGASIMIVEFYLPREAR
jgi:PAS domain S-box-containing protein